MNASTFTSTATTTGSLRARLLWFLLAAIVLAAGVQAAVAYRTVLKEADQLFDYHMQQMALSLRAGLPPSAAVGGLGSGEQNFDFVVQVWTTDGVRIFESAENAALPQIAVLGFADVRARGTTYRVFSVQTRGLVIQVAQDLAVRQRMAGALALRTIGPVALMAPLADARGLVGRESLARAGGAGSAAGGRARGQRALAGERRGLARRGAPAGARAQPAVRSRAPRLRCTEALRRRRRARAALAAHRAQAAGAGPAAIASDEATRDIAIGRLASGIDRATRLVEQMLALARHEASAAAGTPPVQVDLREVARLAVSDAVAHAQARRIDIGLAHADEAAVVQGQPEALRMLLRNLLDNAVKYTPEGGRVDIGIAREADGAVELSVDDSGPGLPEAERERVLDRFYRSDDPQAQGVAGSGLGLAIVKSIADLHGASVTLAESPTLGGLRATVRFLRHA